MKKAAQKVKKGLAASTGQQFQFDVHVDQVSLTMKDKNYKSETGMFILGWKRKARLVCTGEQSLKMDGKDGIIYYSENLSMLSTLSKEGNGFAKKEYKFILEEVRKKGGNKVICSSILDFTQYSKMSEGTVNQKDIKLKPLSSKIASCSLSVVITSKYLRDTTEKDFADALSCISGTSFGDEDQEALLSGDEEKKVIDPVIDLGGTEFGAHMDLTVDNNIEFDQYLDPGTVKNNFQKATSEASVNSDFGTFSFGGKSSSIMLLEQAHRGSLVASSEFSFSKNLGGRVQSTFLDDLSDSDSENGVDDEGDYEGLDSMQIVKKKNEKILEKVEKLRTKRAELGHHEEDLADTENELKQINKEIMIIKEERGISKTALELQKEIEDLKKENEEYLAQIQKFTKNRRKSIALIKRNSQKSFGAVSQPPPADEGSALIEELILNKCELATMSLAFGEVMLEKKNTQKRLATLKLRYIEVSRRLTVADVKLNGLLQSRA